ncbi:MAG: 2-dehydro-3-deoxygalactonokinase [Litoreibacter sp.]|nr:2-dehydro-3-deoxygalactonokinase [Litoreibacter sp.]
MSAETSYADWIAVDWGTSNLRAWAMSECGTVKDKLECDKGMSGLAQHEFEPTLIRVIEPWLGTAKTPIIACGMVGSRQGWAEAPYRSVPTTPLGDLSPVATTDARISMHILPGLKQTDSPNVMRGEETQIAGFLADNPDFDGVLCMPGTHTKWVHISAKEIVSFQTVMTGELFAILSKHSVLRHSAEAEGIDESAFIETVSATLSRPETLAAQLFQIRASHLLEGTENATSRAKLSGLLVGAELAAAKPYWLGQNIALVGHPRLNDLYAKALSAQGLDAAVHTGDDMTLKGLAAAYKELAP